MRDLRPLLLLVYVLTLHVSCLRKSSRSPRSDDVPLLFDPRTGGYLFQDPQTGQTRVATTDDFLPGNMNTAQARAMMRSLPDADIAGAWGPGVVPGGDQKGMASRARQMDVDDSGPVIIPTQRPLQGAQENNRGNSVIFELPNVINAFLEKPIFESPKSSGADAESLVVSLGRENVNQTVDLLSISRGTVDYSALVEWGIGNSTFSVEIDWDFGKVFTIPGSWVRVSGRARVIAVGLNGGPPIENLSASIGYGNVSQSANGLKRSIRIPLLAPAGGQLTVLIPKFATQCGIIGSFPTQGGVLLRLEFLAPDGNGQGIVYYNNDTNTGTQGENAYSIPNTSAAVRITNQHAANGAAPVLFFNLCI
jgi:hypothetical protein